MAAALVSKSLMLMHALKDGLGPLLADAMAVAFGVCYLVESLLAYACSGVL
jgi:hypothetical protein